MSSNLWEQGPTIGRAIHQILRENWRFLLPKDCNLKYSTPEIISLQVAKLYLQRRAQSGMQIIIMRWSEMHQEMCTTLSVSWPDIAAIRHHQKSRMPKVNGSVECRDVAKKNTPSHVFVPFSSREMSPKSSKPLKDRQYKKQFSLYAYPQIDVYLGHTNRVEEKKDTQILLKSSAIIQTTSLPDIHIHTHNIYPLE